ncbi:RNA polymerase sigma-E factor [Clostridium tetani E88]|uniref:RNA polymerase sigma factor n=2 Tax=Clostridium tetani TaxID=1513 RepID=Q895Y8_CLOTE|nr:RNA polymerase sigma-E factor [Clostridium tetani E88]
MEKTINNCSLFIISDKWLLTIYWRDIMFKLKVFLNKILSKLKIFARNIYYIGGSDVLPPPLTREEEENLVEKLNYGDESIRSILIERNLRLVVYIARKFENTGIGIEDLVSVGTIGLIKAVNTFDPSKKIKLATYASRCIENEILMYLRRNNKIKSEISFYEPLNVDWDGNELLLSDILGTDTDIVYDYIEEEVDKELLLIAMDKLNNREKQIVNLRFGLGGKTEKTQKEVADMLGISQSYISRLEKRIIKRLKKEINKMI